MSADQGSREALERLRGLVKRDLAAVDQAIRDGFRSEVQLVDQVAEHIIGGGGKRLRPLMVVLAARACRPSDPEDRPGAGVEAAAFIEFIHTATLLHDDVVDMSARRRGRDTANEIYGNQASVLVGDFVYSRAFQLMAATRSQRVTEIMSEATNIIAEGEVLQLMNAHDPDTTEERYMEVIRRKTAQLFQAGAEVAAVLAGAPKATQEALGAYGRHLGIAYQLVDDALDYASDPETRGKNLGDDLAEGKPTLPLIHALSHAQPAQADMIRGVIRDGGLTHIDAILAAIENSGGLAYTLQKAHQEAAKAVAALAVLPASRYKEGLERMVEFAVQRQH